jgi:signal transduction histidine kinase
MTFDVSDARAVRLLDAAIQHLPSAFALVEAPSGRVLLRNEQTTRIFRVTSTPGKGIAGYSAFTGYHGDGRRYEPEEWPLARSLLTGEVVSGEIAEIVRGDGTRGYIRMTSAPVRDGEGTIVAALVTFDDVTEAETSERQQRMLAAATALLTESLDAHDALPRFARLAVPSVADCCVVHTIADGRIEIAAIEHSNSSKGAAHPDRVRWQEIATHPDSSIHRVLHGAPAEVISEVSTEVIGADGHGAYLAQLGCRSMLIAPIAGRTAVIGSLTFVMGESARRYGARDLGFAEDLGRRAALAIENARLFEHAQALLEREQAARAETEDALRTRDDFLAAASHELRNPLNALQLQLGGLRRIAQRDPALLASPTMVGRLDKTEHQIGRLVRLVDTLLDVSRIKSGRLDLEYDELDLVNVVQEAIQQLEPVADGIPLRLESPPRLTGIWDAVRLEQVVSNLLSNAVKYGDGKPVRIRIESQPATVRIEVQDEGAGIPGDMLSRIFTRFERLTPDRRRGGFGLGLWISRQIVTAMGGRIDVRSELGKGSTFSVELPYRPPAAGYGENVNAAS